MGSVWEAEHIELGTQLAIKLMDPSVAASPEGIRRFKREARAAASLDSPSIVRVFDYGVDGDTPYMAMELLKGESLAQRLRRLGRLDLSSLSSIYLQIGRAISKAHELGIVHRDLKPDNIFLVPGDEHELAKVIDFGIAKCTCFAPGQLDAGATRTGALLGTPFYMSPEQASGSKLIDHRTDVWSLGIIAYECMTGQRPYVSDSIGGLILKICTGEACVPSRQAPVPDGFDAWFARCAAKDPAERYSSARDAVTALSQLNARVGAVPTSDHPNAMVATQGFDRVPSSAVASDPDIRSPAHRSQVDQAGTVALTLPPAFGRSSDRSRSGMVIGWGGGLVVFVGATMGLLAWASSGTRPPSEVGESTLDPSSLDTPPPAQGPRIAPVSPSAPEAHQTRPTSSAPRASVATGRNQELSRGPAAASPRVAQPATPLARRPVVATEQLAAKPTTAVQRDLGSKASNEAPSRPTGSTPIEPPPAPNPFGTRE